MELLDPMIVVFFWGFFLFFFLCLCWVFIAAPGLSLVALGGGVRCGAQASHCSGFSCCRARALGTQASVVVERGLSSCGIQASVVVARGLSSCGSRALERRLSSCGARA